MKKTIRIIFLFLLIQSKANCQDDQCKNILNEYIKSMKEFGAIADKVYCLDYTMIVEYFDKEKRAETISAKLLVSETRSVYKSNLVSMFVDDHDGFMVFTCKNK